MFVGLVELLVLMEDPLPLSVLVVEFLQPLLAWDPMVTELETESWPGDWRSGDRGRSIPISIFGPLLPYRAWPTPPPSMVWPR